MAEAEVDPTNSRISQQAQDSPLGNQETTEQSLLQATSTSTPHTNSPAPQPRSSTSTPAPPHRTATPTKNLNGIIDHSSMPSKSASHGAPARKYLNEKVTRALLEGMKHLAKEQPSDPLRVLGEYLIQKSKELEGS
ncbi:MAG: hypothetical protein M1834_007175 [Cirrosporium novae-zelandiae]|nr:MAG: hypothetical protein M1834_007175 [Cirrosporium novae-zelandiae]